MVMDADVAVTEDGGKSDFFCGDSSGSVYHATKVDRVLHDGDEVTVGGCSRVGSPNVNAGFKLVKNAKYPGIAEETLGRFGS
jgi:metallo-beta-lactamase class B